MVESVQILEVAEHSEFSLLPREGWNALVAQAYDEWWDTKGYFLFGGKIFKRIVIRRLNWDLHGCEYAEGKLECFFVPMVELWVVMQELHDALANPVVLLPLHKVDPIRFG